MINNRPILFMSYCLHVFFLIISNISTHDQMLALWLIISTVINDVSRVEACDCNSAHEDERERERENTWSRKYREKHSVFVIREGNSIILVMDQTVVLLWDDWRCFGEQTHTDSSCKSPDSSRIRLFVCFCLYLTVQKPDYV